LGAQVGRSADYLSVAQFDLLSWVSGGCKGGTYEGTSYRVSARALHNRGLIRVEGRGPTWTAKITAEGRRLLKEQASRVEAERERERREEEARAEREREAQRLRARALEVLEAVTAAGGRLALTADYSEREVTQITDCLARESLLPDGKRFAHEPTRMDPILGVTAYLEPDFAALTPMRAFKVPQQLRGPHLAVTAFQEKREHVSRAQIPRAARYLQGLVNAAAEMGWSAPVKVQAGYAGRSEQGPDLSIKLPSREILVAIRELDERGRPGRAFITQTDYLTRTERTTANKSFTASGKLEVTLTRDGTSTRSSANAIPANPPWRTSCPPSSGCSRSARPRPTGHGKRKNAARKSARSAGKRSRRRPSSTWPTSATPSASSLSSTAAMPRPPCARTPTRSTHTPQSWRTRTRRRHASGPSGSASMPSAPIH
jgi:hypothetical protein